MVRERRHEYKSRECVNVGVRIVKKQRLEERQVVLVVVGGVYAGRLQYHSLNISKCSLMREIRLSLAVILERTKKKEREIYK